jgi:TonB family protein
VKPVLETMPDVAPAVIPDVIPEVMETEPAPVVGEEVPDPAGVAGGVAGGIAGGEIGGRFGGTIGGLEAQPLPDLVKIERDLPLPMGSVSQEFPAYPEYARTRGWEDVLVVRYVIDARGRVKDVSVIKPPERDEFAQATLAAMRHWRFHPFKDVDGTPKEVVHELTVEFKLHRGRRR